MQAASRYSAGVCLSISLARTRLLTSREIKYTVSFSLRASTDGDHDHRARVVHVHFHGPAALSALTSDSIVAWPVTETTQPSGASKKH